MSELRWTVARYMGHGRSLPVWTANVQGVRIEAFRTSDGYWSASASRPDGDRLATAYGRTRKAAIDAVQRLFGREEGR